MLPPEAMLMSEGHADTGDMAKFGPMLPPRAMFESMVLLQLGSLLVSMAHVTNKGQVDVCHLKPY